MDKTLGGYNLDTVLLVRFRLKRIRVESAIYTRFKQGKYAVKPENWVYGEKDEDLADSIQKTGSSIPVVGFVYDEANDEKRQVITKARAFMGRLAADPESGSVTIGFASNSASSQNAKRTGVEKMDFTSSSAPVAHSNIQRLISFFVDEDPSGETDKKYCTFIRDRALAAAVYGLVADNVRTQSVCETSTDGEALWEEDSRKWSRTRDFNRIVQSRAFRRMVDKAQIYGSEQGVLYRTRMTHTLIVARIARQIAQLINAKTASESQAVDKELAETIALAHDLGHTPFGHQGERTLRKKLAEHCGELLSGGFKHNFQSVRVMSYLEESYPSFVGMNVSWKVLEGALCHTKTMQKSSDGKMEYICNFFELDPIYQHNKAWFDDKVLPDQKESGEFVKSRTAEGYIVAIADEIAQRSHDIDDGIMSGRIDCRRFVDGLSRFGLGEYAKDMRVSLERVDTDKSSGRLYVDELDVKRSVLSEMVIDLLVKDTVEGSVKNGKISVAISPKGKELMDYLERFVNRQVLSSQTVTSFDVNAESIVGSIYERLLDKPFLLPSEVLRRYYIMQISAGMKDALDFSNCDFDARNEEMEMIAGQEAKAKETDADRRQELIGCVEKGEWDDPDDSYLVKWVYLNRVIADYIGDMTDAMAKNEHRRICQYR